ncbi:MAG: M20/M25/M40 family metallo-hydrolase [Endomicrobiia bacterium]
MSEMKLFISQYLKKHRKDIIKLTSDIVKIKSYSSQEKELVEFLVKYIKTFPDGRNIKFCVIKNNLLIKIGEQKKSLLYDAHIDTVPVIDKTKWYNPPFSGKIVDGKIYGRGSCDDKGCVAALIFASFAINKFLQLNNNKDLLKYGLYFSLSSNEEDSTGKGIEEILKIVKPTFVVICEPSDLKIVYGHKGKFAFKTTFYGKTSHSSVPEMGKNAIYMAIPFIKNVEMININSKTINLLGKTTTAVTFLDVKTNSFNSIPYECSVYVDYRGVIKEKDADVIKKFVKIIPKCYKRFVKTEILHRYFSPWILNYDHQLIKTSRETFFQSFNTVAKPVLWPFCTNGSVTMGDKKIPTIGFGPGKPYLAHIDNEYIEIEQILDAIKFYFLLPFNLE